jgi:membrane fusion protein (multidrug efflux system)
MRRSILILAGVAVIAAAGVVAVKNPALTTLLNSASLTGATAVTRSEPPPVAVIVAPAARGEVRQTVNALGTLRAQQSVPISSQTGGIIVGSSFTEGALVDAGSPLIQLDARIAQAQYDAAISRVKQAQVRFGRSTELTGAGYKSKQSLDDDRAAFEGAGSDVAARRADLDLLTLRAPFRGVIGQKLFSLGEYITPGKTLAYLEDRTILRLNFHVPERFYTLLALGQSFTITVDAMPGRIFTGKVALIDTRADLDDRDIQIRGEIPNYPQQLLPGLFARVALVIARKPDAVIVPPGTVQYTLTGAYVFKIVGDRVSRVNVKVGLQMVDRVEILDNIAPGDLLVTVGQFNLDDGRRVIISGRQDPPPPQPG